MAFRAEVPIEFFLRYCCDEKSGIGDVVGTSFVVRVL